MLVSCEQERIRPRRTPIRSVSEWGEAHKVFLNIYNRRDILFNWQGYKLSGTVR
uniref:Uncharacterized protein n=1 Tax=uncultured marine virus TaxID=186617 RepID=A0A0F7L5F9_9VIRU|nr:hypothetical protein [uncultured marine virus]